MFYDLLNLLLLLKIVTIFENTYNVAKSRKKLKN